MYNPTVGNAELIAKLRSQINRSIEIILQSNDDNVRYYQLGRIDGFSQAAELCGIKLGHIADLALIEKSWSYSNATNLNTPNPG